MNIVQVSPYVMSRPGGVQAHIRDLSEWLRKQGHRVMVVAPAPPEGPAGSGVMAVGRAMLVGIHGTVTEISFAGPKQLAELRRALVAFAPDILHLHTPWTPLLPYQAWRACRCATVATFHATLPDDAGPLGLLLRASARYFLRRIQAAVIPSEAPLPGLRTTGAVDPVILPPAIDLSPWAAAGESSAGERSGQRVVYLGRLERRKGIEVLLDAWEIVARRVPEAELTIAGGGGLEALVDEAVGRLPRLRRLPSPSNEAALRLVAQSDVFAAPALYGESFGLVLIEAMAAGVVPVAADNPGYRTVMTGDGGKLLVPAGDAAALAARLVSLLEADEERQRLAAWGRAHAARFDVRETGPRYVDLYERVLGGGRRK